MNLDATGIEPRHSEGELAFPQFKYFSCRPISKPARESRIIISVNIPDAGLSSSSLLIRNLNSNCRYILSSSPFFPFLHPDYIFSRFDRVRRGGIAFASKRKQRRVNDSRPVAAAIDFGCKDVGFGPSAPWGGATRPESQRNRRDTTGIYDRPPHYYSMNFNAKRTVSRRDTRGGFSRKRRHAGRGGVRKFPYNPQFHPVPPLRGIPPPSLNSNAPSFLPYLTLPISSRFGFRGASVNRIGTKG